MNATARARTQRGTPVRRERTPTEVHAHHAAIHKIVERWQDGEIDIFTKRALIEEENRFYRGTPLPEAPPEPEPRLVLVQSRFFEEDEDGEQEWWKRVMG